MALRNWSETRLVVIWAGWLLLLLAGLLAMLVASPDGVHLRISPVQATGALRWLLAVAGGLVLVLPPAIVTWVWYVGRLRKESASPGAGAPGA